MSALKKFYNSKFGLSVFGYCRQYEKSLNLIVPRSIVEEILSFYVKLFMKSWKDYVKIAQILGFQQVTIINRQHYLNEASSDRSHTAVLWYDGSLQVCQCFKFSSLNIELTWLSD